MIAARRTLLTLVALLLPTAAVRTDDKAPAQDKDQSKAIDDAINKAQGFLIKQQNNGNWDGILPGLLAQQRGGVSCLVLLALLESGVPPQDPTIQGGLDYLRKLPPKSTYTVALQTAVFARAEPKKDDELIKRNVKWIMDTAKKPANGQLAWGYPNDVAAGPDNSNTQFAVLALNAAAGAGVKVEDETWRRIGNYYAATQLPTGGWSYPIMTPRSERLTMTSAGVFALGVVAQRDKTTGETTRAALEKGLKRIGETFRIKPAAGLGTFPFYSMYAVKRAGLYTNQRTFKDGNGAEFDWYREGSRYLLESQFANGRWELSDSFDGKGAVATSFALLFLAGGDGVRK